MQKPVLSFFHLVHMVAVDKQKGLLVNIKMAFIFCQSESVSNNFLITFWSWYIVFDFIYVFF